MLSALPSDVEAERQLAAAADRHHEMLASMQELGRPEAGQYVAVKAADRAVRLVCFALRRGAEAGIPVERLAELTGWSEELVREGLAQTVEPRFVAKLVPAGLEHSDVAKTAAGVTATARLHALTQTILNDALDHEAWSPTPDDLDDLHERLETEWRSWRDQPHA
jgi:hypothetical protein